MDDRYIRSGATGTVVREEDEKNTQETYNEQETAYGQVFKSYLDGYEGHNPKYVMNKLRTDRSLMSELTNKMYQDSMSGTNEESKLEELGKSKSQILKETEGRVRRVLNRELYEGEEVDTTIKNSLKKLRDSQDHSRVMRARQTIQNNPESYDGFLDDSGKLVMDDISLQDSLKSDDDLYNQLMDDRFKEYEEQLTKSHNAGTIDTNTDTTNPDEYGRGFLIYDKYGKEGLSHYINLMQHYDPEKEYEEQNLTAQNAIEFYKGKKNGQSPEEYVDGAIGEMNFEPVKVGEVPEYNQNPFTDFWYQQNDRPDDRVFTSATDAKAMYGIFQELDMQVSEMESEMDFLGGGEVLEDESAKRQFEQVDQSEIMPSTFINSLTNEGEEFYETDLYHSATTLSGKLALDQEYDGPLKAQNLIQTIQAYASENGERSKTSHGVKYGIDYKQAPLPIKYALDSLKDRAGFDTMFSVEGENVVFEPRRMERIQQNFAETVDWIAPMDTEERVLPDGEVLQRKKLSTGQQNDGSISDNIGGAYNLFLSAGLGFAKVFYDTGAQWVGGTVQRAGELANLAVNGDVDDETAFGRWADQEYERVRENIDASVMGLSDNYLHKGAGLIGSLGGFLGMLKSTGRKVNSKLGSKVSGRMKSNAIRERVKMLSDIRKSKNFSGVAKLLKPPKNSKGKELYKQSTVRMRKTAEGLKGKGERWANDYLDYVTGGAVYETLSTATDKNYQDRYSLIGSGMADLAMDQIGFDTDLEGKYQKLGNGVGGKLLQLGIGVVAEEVLGHTLDTAIGALRMGKNGAFKLFGKDYSGLFYEKGPDGSLTGQIKKTKKGEMFTPDWRRFWKELNRDLDEIPRDDYSSILNGSGKMVGESLGEIKDMNSLAKTVATSVKPFVQDLKGQIRDTVAEYNKGLGDESLDESEIDQITQKLYTHFYDQVTEGMGRMMDGEEVTAFMRGLEDFDEVSVERVTKDGSNYMTEADARELALETDNARVQRVQDEDGNEAYEVIQVTTNKWVGDFIGALDRHRKNRLQKVSLDNFKESDYFKNAENKREALDYYHTIKDGNLDLSLDGERYIAEGVEDGQFVLKDVTGAERRVPLDEFEDRMQIIDTEGSSGRTETDQPTPNNNVKQNIEAKQGREKGRKWIADNREDEEELLKDLDSKNLKSVNDTRKKLTEELKRLNELRTKDSADVDAIDARMENINNAMEHLDSRRKSLQLDRAVRKRARALTKEELEVERETARLWMDENGYEVDYDSRESIESSLEQLNRAEDKFTSDIDYGNDKNVQLKAQRQIGEIKRAKEMLNARKKELDKGVRRTDNLGEGTKRWLENEKGLINLWNPDEIRSRINTLENIRENPSASSSFDGYRQSEVDSAIEFLNKRLELLEGDSKGTPAKDSQMREVVKGDEERATQKRVDAHRQRSEDSLGKGIKRVDENLEEGEVKSYRGKVVRAKKNDKGLEKTGVQTSFINSTGQKVNNPDEARTVVTNIGGSPATDYNKVGKQRGVRKWDHGKGGKKGRIYRVQNEDGSVDHVIVNHKPVHPHGGNDSTVPMQRFIKIDGEYRLNPYYRFVSPNKLTEQTGELQRVSVADVPDPRPEFGGAVVRVDESGELVANVQRPIGESGKSVDEGDFIKGNYDAIEFTHNGETYHKLVAKDQVMEVGQVTNNDLRDVSKFGLYDVSPSYRATGANAPYKHPTPIDGLEDDMKALGFVNEELFNKLRKSAKEPVEGNTKEIKPSYYDEKLDELTGEKKSVYVSSKHHPDGKGDFADRVVREDKKNGGYYIKFKKRKMYLNINENGRLEVDDVDNPKGVNKSVEAEPVKIDELEEGDVFSTKVGDELKNGEIHRIDEETGTIYYRTFGEDGKKGEVQILKENKIPHTQWYKAFAMTTPAVTIMAFGDDLDINDSDFEMQEASLSGFLATLMLGGMATKALTKGAVKIFPKGYKRTQRWAKGFVRESIGDPATAKTREFFHKGTKLDPEELRAMGIEATDGASNDFARDMVDLLENGSVEDIGRALMHNRYLQSTKSFAEMSNSKTLVEFIDILEGMERKIGSYRMSFEDEFNTKHGTNAFKDFFQRDWERVMQQVDTDNLEINELKGQFDNSIWRLMSSELEFNDDGTARILNQPDHFEKIYDEGNREFLQEIDGLILNDEKAVDAIKSMRSIFKKTKTEWMEALKKHEVNAGTYAYLPDKLRKVKRNGQVYQFSESEYVRLIDNFIMNFDGSFKEYKEVFDNGFVRGVLANAQKADPSVKKLISIRNKQLKFTEGLEEHYFPQMVSRAKVNAEREKFYKQVPFFGGNGKYESREEANKAFNEQLRGEMEQYNDIGGKLAEFDKGEGKMKEKQFKSADEAVAYLNRMLNNVSDFARSSFEREYGRLSVEGSDTSMGRSSREQLLDANIIRERTEQVDLGDGRKKWKTYYVLDNEQIKKVPHFDAEGNRQEFDLIKEANTKAFDDLHEHILMGSFVKNSNFLERPRVYNLPPKYLETSPLKVLDKYARDVGFRMEMVRNGAIDEDALNRNWFDKIEKELGKATRNEKGVGKQMERVKSAYNIMSGIAPDLPANKKDRQAYFKKQMRYRQMCEVWRNMLYSKYAISIGMLDTIQPLISTSIYTSYKSAGKAYGAIGRKESLNNLLNISKEHNVIADHIEKLMPDYLHEAQYNTAGDTMLDKWLGKSVQGSRKWSHMFTEKFDWRGPKKWGLGESGAPRLMFGSLVAKNQVNITHAWYSFLGEAIELGKTYKRMADGEEVKGMSIGDVKQRLELLGVNRDKIEKFANNVEEVENMMLGAKEEGTRLDSSEIDTDYKNIIENVIFTASETYTGRNKMWRPESWHSNTGRAITTFQNFAFNQALQITQNRFIKPLDNWMNKYGDELGEFKKVKLGTMLFSGKVMNPKTRNKAFKNMGLSQEAIDDMPYRAIETFGKVVLSTGINSVFNWTLTSLKAFASLAIGQSLLGHDMEKSEDKLDTLGWDYDKGEFNMDDLVINGQAYKKDQVDLGEITDPRFKKNLSEVATYMWAGFDRLSSEAFDIGIGGPFIGNILKYGDFMPAGASLGLRFLESGVNTAKTMGSPEFWKWENMPKAMYNTGATVLPPMSILDGAQYDMD